MKKHKELWKPFLSKEKFLIILIVFILINISLYIVYKDSIYSNPGYQQQYPNTGLSLYYYFHNIGANPFLMIIMMLLLPNLISYDFLNLQLSHASYLIETRIPKKTYYTQMFIKNIIMSAGLVFLLECCTILIIHCFYVPIQFNATTYMENYYIVAQLLSSNEIMSMILFVLMTSIGYSIVSSLLFSLQFVITNKYIYRCFGVIFGILLVVIPALIQGYLPFPDAAFLLQINNLIALGIENVRVNPFGLSHYMMYFITLIIYFSISTSCFKVLLKWRQAYD
ncbi:MAG: hypothetical protein RR428_01045 [Coprobacillus sp.]